MTALPILFNDEMVRAILDGRKSQTRRPVRFRPGFEPGGEFCDLGKIRSNGVRDSRVDHLGRCAYHSGWSWQTEHSWCDCRQATYACPFDALTLWVREAWRAHRLGGDPGSPRHGAPGSGVGVDYIATPGGGCNFNEPDWCLLYSHEKRRPSIHMPRWASRTTLLVKRVWVERLQEISLDDIRAEGIVLPHPMLGIAPDGEPIEGEYADKDPWWFFSETWDSIYAAKSYGWVTNPFVWCCEFEVQP